MLASLSLIFLTGLAMSAVFRRMKLPGIIGMLISGVLLGPYVLNLLDSSVLSVSADLRQMALIIILLKAGLSLDLSDLKKVGRPSVMMSCLPASFEILAFILFAPHILGVTRIEAAVMGAVLGAVSPAVVVPRMVKLIETGYGTDEGIPQLIMAGASCDDIFVIVLFSAFVNMAQGGSLNIIDFVNIPVSVVLGVVLGFAAGYILSMFFETAYVHGRCIRNSLKIIVILGASFLLTAVEAWAEGIISISGLLAVIGMACVIRKKSPASVSKRLSDKLGKIWLAAEIILFVLVGASVDIRYTFHAGISAILMIVIALVFRSLGVAVCLLGTSLSLKERVFCMIAYIPKATVQAAIGSVPLAMGLPCGQLVLSAAVLAIIITAPIGAFGIDRTYKKLLKRAE